MSTNVNVRNPMRDSSRLSKVTFSEVRDLGEGPVCGLVHTIGPPGSGKGVDRRVERSGPEVLGLQTRRPRLQWCLLSVDRSY